MFISYVSPVIHVSVIVFVCDVIKHDKYKARVISEMLSPLDLVKKKL